MQASLSHPHHKMNVQLPINYYFVHAANVPRTHEGMQKGISKLTAASRTLMHLHGICIDQL